MEFHSMDERAAASAVASLKRSNNDPDVAGCVVRKSKVSRTGPAPNERLSTPSLQQQQQQQKRPAIPEERSLQPAPFFYYKDFSTETDPDPLTPLTLPGRVPNFPAKLHSILSRPELADVVAWMPHGRSWRVLKPREFEIRVLPTYFEHAKFSSFIRQANGWGFRRITQGKDRNSYYHERFLRGLPHLCKKMRRPGVTEKKTADVNHEPDFYKISELHPVPEKMDDGSLMMDCTLQGGPKARMPICAALTPVLPTPNSSQNQNHLSAMNATLKSPTLAPKLSPFDQHKLGAFHQSIFASEMQLGSPKPPPTTTAAAAAATHPQVPAVPAPAATAHIPSYASAMNHPTPAFVAPTPSSANPFNPIGAAAAAAAASRRVVDTAAAAQGKMSVLAAANRLAMIQPGPQIAAAMNASTAASQFAAGFAAATVISQQQIRDIIGSLTVSGAAAAAPPPSFPPPQSHHLFKG